jgi:5-oxopent-3-ene-1,2,5-tricarboxylate decarboxylase/2-hydroxyhepta-2,4-diene-1,7-dioate isomerase
MQIPRNIHCLALNYPGVGDTTTPLYFIKGQSTFNPDATIVEQPKDIHTLWTEVELGIVISADCHQIPTDNAKNYIAGFTICADISANNIDNRDHHLAYSKSRAGFCPTSTKLKQLSYRELFSCSLKTYVNGKLTQEGQITDMKYKPDQCVSYISSLTPLLKGDLILTGTPKGVENNILYRGDTIFQAIDNIGHLEYKIV